MTAKQRYDETYDTLQARTTDYQAVIVEQSTYKDRLRAARQVLLDAKAALKTAAQDVQRESSVPLSGRPPGNAAKVAADPKPTSPAKKATKKK